jgi:hypothetical protein
MSTAIAWEISVALYLLEVRMWVCTLNPPGKLTKSWKFSDFAIQSVGFEPRAKIEDNPLWSDGRELTASEVTERYEVINIPANDPAHGLILREEPGIDAHAVDTIREGENVSGYPKDALLLREKTWIPVEWNKKKGYLSMQYLKHSNANP